ncbi:MAG: hypothetical protein LBC92_02015 [Rickettsiales bacterium]|jgi:hypothetical protein|nr:hypothetical protein [Rickettsiales bacterium]
MYSNNIDPENIESEEELKKRKSALPMDFTYHISDFDIAVENESDKKKKEMLDLIQETLKLDEEIGNIISGKQEDKEQIAEKVKDWQDKVIANFEKRVEFANDPECPYPDEIKICDKIYLENLNLVKKLKTENLSEDKREEMMSIVEENQKKIYTEMIRTSKNDKEREYWENRMKIDNVKAIERLAIKHGKEKNKAVEDKLNEKILDYVNKYKEYPSQGKDNCPIQNFLNGLSKDDKEKYNKIINEHANETPSKFKEEIKSIEKQTLEKMSPSELCGKQQMSEETPSVSKSPETSKEQPLAAKKGSISTDKIPGTTDLTSALAGVRTAPAPTFQSEATTQQETPKRDFVKILDGIGSKFGGYDPKSCVGKMQIESDKKENKNHGRY